MAGKVKLTEASLDVEKLAMLRAVDGNHLSMRLRACRARSELKDVGYIVATKSGNWKADKRRTYWQITPAGRAHLASSGKGK